MKSSIFEKNVKRKKISVLIFFILFVIIPLFINCTRVYALENGQIIDILLENPKFFINNSVHHDTFRNLGWAILSILVYLASSCQELYENTLGLLDFTTSETIESWIQEYNGVVTAIFALSIMILGIILIVNHEKKPKLFISICLAGISLTAISYILALANEGVEAFSKEIIGETMAIDVVNQNFYDLLYIDTIKGLATLDSSNSDYLKDCHYENEIDWLTVDINEVINYSSPDIVTEEAKQILGNQVKRKFKLNGEAEYKLKAIFNGIGWNSGEENDPLNNYYYRYTVDFFIIDVNLIAIILVFLCMSYKVMRIIYEIAAHRILAVLYSADLNGTQKTIKIFTSLKDGYIVILLTAILVKIFKMFQQGLSDRFLPDSSFTYSILFLFVAFAVIDGPNVIQQLTGIDAGLSSGVGKLIAGYHMLRGAKASVGNAGRLAAWPLERSRQNKMHREILNSNASKNNNMSGLQGNKTSAEGISPKNNENKNNGAGSPESNEKKSDLKKDNLNQSGTNTQKDNDKNSGEDLNNKENLSNMATSSENSEEAENKNANMDALNGQNNCDDSENRDMGTSGSSSLQSSIDSDSENSANMSRNLNEKGSLKNMKDNPLRQNSLNSNGADTKKMKKDLKKMESEKSTNELNGISKESMSSYNGEIYGTGDSNAKESLGKTYVSGAGSSDISATVSTGVPNKKSSQSISAASPEKKEKNNKKSKSDIKENPINSNKKPTETVKNQTDKSNIKINGKDVEKLNESELNEWNLR